MNARLVAVSGSVHSGTHMDAPFHFQVDQFRTLRERDSHPLLFDRGGELGTSLWGVSGGHLACDPRDLNRRISLQYGQFCEHRVVSEIT